VSAAVNLPKILKSIESGIASGLLVNSARKIGARAERRPMLGNFAHGSARSSGFAGVAANKDFRKYEIKQLFERFAGLWRARC